MANVGETVTSPGGMVGLRWLFGPGYHTTDQNEQNTFREGDLARLRGSGFNLDDAMDVYGKAARGEYTLGRSLADYSAELNSLQRVGGWGDELNSWVTGPSGYGSSVNRQRDANYGGDRPIIGSDIGQTWGAVRNAFDSGNKGLRNGDDAINDLMANYRGNFEDSGSNPQGNWWVGQTRQNTDRGNQPAGTWANNLGNTHANRIYGVETSGPQQDTIGQRGVAQVTGLTNGYEQQLLRDIDTENGLNLADQLTDTRRLLGSAGLGSSGAGQRVMSDQYRRAQEQGQRDKMRTMSDIRDRNIQRQTEAIRQGTDIGASAAESRKGRLAQANTDWTNLAMQGRQTEQAQDYDAYMKGQMQRQGWLQSLSERGFDLGSQMELARGQQDMQRYGIDAEMIRAADESNRARIGLGNQANQYGIDAQMRAWEQVNNMQRQRYDDMLRMDDRDKQQQLARLNQQLQYGMMPLQMYQTMMTGISPGSAPTAQYSPWANMAANLAGNYGASLLQGGGNALYDYARQSYSNGVTS